MKNNYYPKPGKRYPISKNKGKQALPKRKTIFQNSFFKSLKINAINSLMVIIFVGGLTILAFMTFVSILPIDSDSRSKLFDLAYMPLAIIKILVGQKYL